MTWGRPTLWAGLLAGLVATALHAGPFSAGLNDPTNPYDAPVPGFVGPDGTGKARLSDGSGGFINPRNVVNPLFFGWGFAVADYYRADGEAAFDDPTLTLGPVTGDAFNVASLGDLNADDIAAHATQGFVTLQVGSPTLPIRNLPGADFVVFENSIVSASNTGGTGVGGVFADLGYVEVSSDGVNFARFPSTSLTPGTVGAYGTINPTNVFNLTGKHANAYGDCWGTPFDLAQLANDPSVLNGTVNLSAIQYVRVVDVPGDGSYRDAASPFHFIYDAWLTVGSGGVDLEAIGSISVQMTFDQWQDWKGLTGLQRGPQADPDKDGAVNVVEYALGMEPLAQDAALLPTARLVNGVPAIRLRRDARAVGALVEVLGTTSLQQTWQVLAKAQPGGDLLPVVAGAATVLDESASPIASIGVVRQHHVYSDSSVRFFRVRVTLSP